MTQIGTHHATPGVITTRSARIAVLDHPAGPARDLGTALLVPGFTGSKEDFVPILDRLAAAGYRSVAMDQPGQYQSPGPAGRDAYTVDWLGGVVGEVAAALGAKVHLVGHSFGGLVARAAVLADPDRYSSLVLLGSGPAGLDGGRRERMDRLRPLADEGMAALHAAIEEESLTDLTSMTMAPELRDFLRERFLASSAEGLIGMGEALTSEPDRVLDLRMTGVAVLVAFGTADDAWAPMIQRDMAVRLGATIAAISGAGHSPAIDRPPTTAHVLTSFWGHHPS